MHYKRFFITITLPLFKIGDHAEVRSCWQEQSMMSNPKPISIIILTFSIMPVEGDKVRCYKPMALMLETKKHFAIPCKWSLYN